jgi:hypothetical protein
MRCRENNAPLVQSSPRVEILSRIPGVYFYRITHWGVALAPRSRNVPAAYRHARARVDGRSFCDCGIGADVFHRALEKARLRRGLAQVDVYDARLVLNDRSRHTV